MNLAGKWDPGCRHGLLEGEGAEPPITTCHLMQRRQEGHPGEGLAESGGLMGTGRLPFLLSRQGAS